MKSRYTVNSKKALALIESFALESEEKQCLAQDTQVSDSIKLPAKIKRLPANIYFGADFDAQGTEIEVFNNHVAGTADFSGSQLRQIGPHAHYKALRMENTPLKDRLLLYRKNMELRAQFPEEVALLVGEPDNSLWVHPSAPLPEKILEATNLAVQVTVPFVMLCETRVGSFTPLGMHSRNGHPLDRKAEQEEALDEIAPYLAAALANLEADCLNDRWDPFSRPPAPLATPAYAQSR